MKSNKIMTVAVAGAVSVGLAMAASSVTAASSANNMEKCYGVAKAGMNDCGGKGAGHTCQGQSKKAGDPNEWLLVPKGLCDKLVGGSTTPGYEKSGSSDSNATNNANGNTQPNGDKGSNGDNSSNGDNNSNGDDDSSS